jgi:MFS family permease
MAVLCIESYRSVLRGFRRLLPRLQPEKKHSVRALQAASFFLADVQTGLGPFLAAYLAGAGWEPDRVGVVLTVGGIVTVVLQTPAGAIVDRARSKRLILVLASLVLALGAILLSLTADPWAAYAAQFLIGGAGPFLAPTLAAVTMGLVGVGSFDRQFGKNQSFNSAGNVVCALSIAGVSRLFGNRAIFITAAVLTVPTILSVLSIRRDDIDYELARGGRRRNKEKNIEAASITKTLLGDRILLTFLVCAFFFHFANAAMLPQLGEMLSTGAKATAAPFMSACIVVTQVVIMCSASAIGRYANVHGRKRLLLLGFGVLPVRALLYTLTHNTMELIAIQLLDGIANAIFGVVAVLVVADRTRGTGRFNLVQGALATAVGLGAALSTSFGGKLIQTYSFNISFLALGGVAAIALALLWLGVPETLRSPTDPDADTPIPPHTQEAST